MAVLILSLVPSLIGCPPNTLLSDIEQGVDDEKTPERVATPVFSPTAPEGTVTSSIDLTGDSAVTITCSTPEATIHYTVDGSTPSASTAAYTGPIPVSGDQTRMTICAIGVASGMTDSELAQQTYLINYNHYSVLYDGNGNTGGDVPTDSTVYVSGQQVTVQGCGTLVRAGWLFTGWNTMHDGSGSAYASGALFNIGGADVTLYAQWQFLKLAAPDGATGDWFGSSVAASSDGSTLVVGARNKKIGEGSTYQGAAYVFTRSGNAWLLARELTASDGGPSNYFGESVAVSADGGTIVVGASNSSNPGAAYVFTGSGSNWTEAQKLTAVGGAGNNYFGSSVAVSTDGSVIAVGAEGAAAAYMFTKSGSTWSQIQKLISSDGGGAFGCSIAMSSDGGTLIVGALNNNAAYVFTGSGSWTQVKKLIEGAKWFGWSVAASSDGSTLVAGTINNNGAAYVFTGSGSWTLAQTLTASDGVYNDNFGISVAITGDGTTITVGASDKKIGSNASQGAAYVFTGSGSTWSQSKEFIASDGVACDCLGTSTSVASDGSTLLFGAGSSSSSVKGAAYVLRKSDGSWVQ